MTTRPFAQADRATIEGIITDTASAPIPDVHVLILCLEANDEIVLRTNESGRYFRALPPAGQYRVTASKEGFQPEQLDEIVVR